MTLQAHLEKIHGVSHDEYRERFGLPWSRGLVCKNLSKTHGRNMRKKLREGITIPGGGEPSWAASIGKPRRSPQPFLVKINLERLPKAHQALKKWGKKDYERVLARMRKEKKIMPEICKDKDLPSVNRVRVYQMQNPDFQKKVIATYKALPFSEQARAHMLDERFDKEARKLHKRGFSMDEIGEKLGVRPSTVKYRLQRKQGKKR
jgi:hypothetical protein